VLKKAFVVFGFACAVWALCGALVGIGRQFMSLETTLYVHAIGAPLGAAVLGWIYFRKFGYTSPLATAVIFVSAALTLDVFVVAMLIEKSFAMFRSTIGIWIPQMLIFITIWITGSVALKDAARSPR
jgi:hypothetical protein